mmetsp:Transcript_31989/g.57325  ORF Transcript_31989/g.57325 Transcript_31989/m.57325 type:complete len:209 (-) Transcript_31989:115-741(-)
MATGSAPGCPPPPGARLGAVAAPSCWSAPTASPRGSGSRNDRRPPPPSDLPHPHGTLGGGAACIATGKGGRAALSQSGAPPGAPLPLSSSWQASPAPGSLPPFRCNMSLCRPRHHTAPAGGSGQPGPRRWRKLPSPQGSGWRGYHLRPAAGPQSSPHAQQRLQRRSGGPAPQESRLCIVRCRSAKRVAVQTSGTPTWPLARQGPWPPT